MTRRVRVSRSGGVAGLRRDREVDLDEGSSSALALTALVDSGQFRGGGGEGQPDGFVYRLTDDNDLDLTVHEQDLSDDDRALLEEALRS